MDIDIHEDYVTSRAPEFVLCSVQPPPPGCKVQLLTIGGVAIYGTYNKAKDEKFVVAWAPLPKLSSEVKTELERMWKTNQEHLY